MYEGETINKIKFGADRGQCRLSKIQSAVTRCSYCGQKLKKGNYYIVMYKVGAGTAVNSWIHVQCVINLAEDLKKQIDMKELALENMVGDL